MDVAKVKAVGNVLNDPCQTLTKRFRALFTLKSLAGEEAIVQIARCFSDPSALLKHECAYCLGQMEDARALPILCQLLEDLQQDSIVRHEAAEALGAIGDPKSLELLCKFASDSVPEVAETCQIAVHRLKWLEKEKQNVNGNPLYGSVDPAPPLLEGDPLISEEEGLTVKNCGKLLVDKNISLFQRYQAMFALRDKGCDEAVDAILAGFSAESALFKHELAFVLGQMRNPLAVPGLLTRLGDLTENPMVRHECAEALGSIATPTCLKALERFLEDKEQVVRESCEVALDMLAHEHSSEFQYANTFAKVS